MTTKIKLNRYTAESATIYATSLIEACIKAKVADPLRALEDADDYPRLLKIQNVEFAIGWIHGVAEAHGVTVKALWGAVAPVYGYSPTRPEILRMAPKPRKARAA